MSLRQAIRSRFKSDKADDKDSDSSMVRKGSEKRERTYSGQNGKECEEAFEVVVSDKEEDGLSFHSASSTSPQCPGSPEHNFSDSEKMIFEHQLNQLQEQLVAVMIENQSLQTELKEYKEHSSLDKLKQELEYQKRCNEMLEAKCNSLDRKRSRKIQRSKSDVDRGRHLQDIDVSHNLNEDDSFSDSSVDIKASQKMSFFDRVWEGVVTAIYEVMDDFSEVPDQKQEEETEGDPLTVKKLKDNIKRFGSAAKPYLNTMKGLYNLVTWNSPPYTLIVFIVYMYSLYKGWFLPVFMFCLTFRLVISYLKYRGWNVSFNFLDPGEDDKESEEIKELGVSDKFNLVLLVARKVQNILGTLADSLEKIKSLLTWRHPPATKQVFLVVAFGTIMSCVFPTSYLFYFAGLYMGVKVFLIDYMFLRFPRLRQKYDTTYKLWMELPTDANYEKRHMKSEIDKYILPKAEVDRGDKVSVHGSDMSADDKSFCELFSLPVSECPLPGWQGGRRCTLINREKSLTAAFKNGKLFLTRSFLCFERTKTASPKNIVIPLADITRIEKAKPYSWLPGGGMAIEVAVTGTDKTQVFGAIINRDEAFDSIVSAGQKANLSWAGESEVISTGSGAK